ncbi:MAG: hypothetical protein AVDCRST_MAG16-3148 [uncultured Frankineae bacterium]|uniref:non-specific serine/threonine protein kinase n=1 Tax=uncultured Frankineae bacterium TaxID=437475 RepID=A0A6J4MKL6_9ACTN|nr:MAG: hypothetical protein AVDCRST_MAG16-3148 [uncultured Frankineae bacterium]
MPPGLRRTQGGPVAPPPGTRGAAVLRDGDLLAARYRLVRPIASSTPGVHRSAQLWLASDEVLARPVAAKVLHAAGPDGATVTAPFLDAAVAAGAVSFPVLTRVYDAAVEQRPADGGPPVDVAYVISEWVDGTALTTVLERDGPFGPAEAVALTTALAEAVSVAHAGGLVHGRLHPGNVLLSRAGSVRLTDLAVAAALPDGRVAADRADDPGPVEADVRDLAALLYALLTARWPAAATPQPSGGVPGAPSLREGPNGRGKLVSPRQVRAGVPRALDLVVHRALDPVAARDAPALTTPAALSDACEAAVRADTPGRTPPVRRASTGLPAAVRRRLPLLAVLALLTAIGVASFSVGRTVGTVVTPPDSAAAGAGPGPSSPVPAAVPLDLTGVPVRDFDPDGDGRERPGSVPNAHDGDLSTAWVTERYDSADLGGLKDGVGLLVDLGAPTAVSRAELVLSSPGVSAELRAAPEPAATSEAYRVLARATATGDRLALVPPAGTRERYVLVWLTGLAADDGRFTAGIEELLFTG